MGCCVTFGLPQKDGYSSKSGLQFKAGPSEMHECLLWALEGVDRQEGTLCRLSSLRWQIESGEAEGAGAGVRERSCVQAEGSASSLRSLG